MKKELYELKIYPTREDVKENFNKCILFEGKKTIQNWLLDVIDIQPHEATNVDHIFQYVLVDSEGNHYYFCQQKEELELI